MYLVPCLFPSPLAQKILTSATPILSVSVYKSGFQTFATHRKDLHRKSES